MKPGDVIKALIPYSSPCWWTVAGVHLGGLGQEGLIELVPESQSISAEGRALVPVRLLEAALRKDAIKLYQCTKHD